MGSVEVRGSVPFTPGIGLHPSLVTNPLTPLETCILMTQAQAEKLLLVMDQVKTSNDQFLDPLKAKAVSVPANIADKRDLVVQSQEPKTDPVTKEFFDTLQKTMAILKFLSQTCSDPDFRDTDISKPLEKMKPKIAEFEKSLGFSIQATRVIGANRPCVDVSIIYHGDHKANPESIFARNPRWYF